MLFRVVVTGPMTLNECEIQLFRNTGHSLKYRVATAIANMGMQLCPPCRLFHQIGGPQACFPVCGESKFQRAGSAEGDSLVEGWTLELLGLKTQIGNELISSEG